MVALEKYSKWAKVFALIHKMDTIPERDRETIFEERRKDIEVAGAPFAVQCFMTSIWDETLYKAWSSITRSLISNIDIIETGMKELASIINADELVIFEKSTFLEITHIVGKEYNDPYRFEKISNIIKQFKLGLYRTTYAFESMSVKNSRFRAYLINFTKASYMLVVVSDPNIEEIIIKMNIDSLRPHYDPIITAALDK